MAPARAESADFVLHEEMSRTSTRSSFVKDEADVSLDEGKIRSMAGLFFQMAADSLAHHGVLSPSGMTALPRIIRICGIANRHYRRGAEHPGVSSKYLADSKEEIRFPCRSLILLTILKFVAKDFSNRIKDKS